MVQRGGARQAKPETNHRFRWVISLRFFSLVRPSFLVGTVKILKIPQGVLLLDRFGRRSSNIALKPPSVNIEPPLPGKSTFELSSSSECDILAHSAPGPTRSSPGDQRNARARNVQETTFEAGPLRETEGQKSLSPAVIRSTDSRNSSD